MLRALEIGGDAALERARPLGEQPGEQFARAALQRPAPLRDQRGQLFRFVMGQLGPAAHEFFENRQIVVVAERRSQPMEFAADRLKHRRPRRLERPELMGKIDDAPAQGVQSSAAWLASALWPRARAER